MYLLSDHLGSASLTTNASGALISELRYKPWGETRYSAGNEATKYQYTGQYSNVSDFGLYFYNARWYDPALGRFAQADSIVPGGVQGWDRYAYVNNSPVVYVDPSGHAQCRTKEECTDMGTTPMGGRGRKPQPLSGDDPTRLTLSGSRGSGIEMQAVYTRLAGMCAEGTWQHSFCSEGLTLKEFVIIILSSELSSLGSGVSTENQEKLATAAKNWFGDNCTGHPNNPCSGPTPNALLNWMGENLESGQRLFPSGVTPTEEYPQMWGIATKIVNAVLTVGAPPYSHPFDEVVHWANKSYYIDKYGSVPSDAYAVLGGGDTFYVVPYSEEARMCGGWPCP